jgi:hypothetical protein
MKHIAKIQAEFLRIAQDDMSGTVHREKEKRVTLHKLPSEIENVKPTLIRQGILREVKLPNGKNEVYARVRMKQEPEKAPTYSLGVKNLPLQQEAETEISKEMFDSFFPDNVSRPQTKYRYSLANGWDVDVVDGTDEIYAECEGGEPMPRHWM